MPLVQASLDFHVAKTSLCSPFHRRKVVPLLPFLSPAIILHKILIWAMCSFDSYVKNLVMNTYIELLISLIIYPL